MEKRKSRSPKLSSGQEKLLKGLEEQLKGQNKKSKRQSGVIIGVIVVLLIASLIYNYFAKPAAAPVKDGISVHFIDVGQGDCVYITGNGENMLIDCGESSQADKVIGYLEKQGVDRLDCVVATHPHSDHMGGMSKIVSEFDIGEFIIPHLADNDIPTTMYFNRFLDAVEEKQVKLTEAKVGRKKEICGGEWEIIAPNSGDYSNANNYSVGLFLRHGENSFIFTGDAETSAEKEMLSAGRVSHADVYKVAHHGSDTSTSDDFLSAVSPDIAVISCGADNSYGHPCDSTLEKLKKFTNRIYRTDLSGTIIITSDGEKLDVRTERSSR